MSEQSFSAFERAGWEDTQIVAQYAAHLSNVTRQCIPALLDDAGVQAGVKVLDVATGPGYVAAAAFARGAIPVGIDFSDAQVEFARRHNPAITFTQGDAQALPFESDSFDAVVIAYGVCHFPNPDIALKEAYRVLKKGGRIAFAMWDLPERAIGLGAVFSAIQTHGSLDVDLPAGPNFFLFSDPTHSMNALRQAGFDSPSVRQVPQVLQLSAPDQLFDIMSGSSVRAGAIIAAQNDAQKAAIRTALSQTVSIYQSGEFFNIPMPAIVVSAVKP
jgi:ubiquinone/menaquinone biosynthesis C-methylase UbiE